MTGNQGQDPMVSVVVPTYNRADVLPRAIDSVLNQTFDDFELLIVDDGSTDETESVVVSYQDNRVSYISLEKNSGANAARNMGIRHASGEYISFLDSDDELHSDHLELAVTKLEMSEYDVRGVYLSSLILTNGELTRVNNANNTLNMKSDVLHHYPAGGFSGLTFYEDVFSDVGLLDPSLDAFQDREFLIRFLDEYTLAPVSKIAVTCYLQSEGISSNTEAKLNALSDMMEKHYEVIDDPAMANLKYTRGFLLGKGGNVRSARKEFYHAVKLDPANPRYVLQLFFSLFGNAGFKLLNRIKKSAVRFGEKIMLQTTEGGKYKL